MPSNEPVDCAGHAKRRETGHPGRQDTAVGWNLVRRLQDTFTVQVFEPLREPLRLFKLVGDMIPADMLKLVL
ncbi:kinase domain [Cordyceps militaris]|uniref:Kinase domain n=1 Tax=Cordyceps militaris TaxID=73501 RepID=A0A2H4S936_CORMI|nr:kinase domain [Cordyceps militaris]